MTERDSRATAGAELRRQAEAVTRRSRAPEEVETLSPEETRRTLQELRVHQIELEMQNEELRRTRDELEESRTRYFDLYDLAPVGYATLSCEGLILEANLTLATRLGVPRGTLVGALLSRFVAPASTDAYYLSLRRVFEAGRPESVDLEMVTEAGAQTWARIDAVLRPDEGDRTETCRVALTDVTDRKWAEEALLAAHKLEAVGVLAGGIAHDFNNILFAIRGNAGLAQADLPASHPARKYVEEIDRSAKRAASLVEQILSFASPKVSSRAVAPLSLVVDEALRFLRSTVPAAIEFRTEWGEDLPPAALDAGQIHQVIVNLVANSAQAIGLRNGRIDLKIEEVELLGKAPPQEPGLRPGQYLLLTLSDDGCGMDRATLGRAFDPFFTAKTLGTGTGLGLSIVHGIMKGHSGAVTVSSEPGLGTTFRLYFPAAQARPLARPEERPAEDRVRTERILIVDDEEAIVQLIPDLLARKGYRSAAFSGPREALEEFRKAPAAFDAVVTDVSMPGMSGFDLAREILALRPELPVIVTSGYVRPEYVEEAARLGVSEIIRKPDTVDQLADALDRIFRK